MGTTPLALLDPPPLRDQDPYWVYLDGLRSPESKRAMQRCLDKITRLYLADAGRTGPDDQVNGRGRAWHTLQYSDTARIRAVLLSKDMPPGTLNQHLTALRQVLKRCRLLGLMPADQYMVAIALDGVSGSRLPAGRSVHPDELASLLGACVDLDSVAVIDVRDAALLAFLYSTGCRRAEAAGALLECYDPGTRTLRVIGKRNKQREVYLTPNALTYLDPWLVRLNARRGPIFRPMDKWGNIYPRHMGPRAVGRIVDKRRVRAGLQPLSTHDLRRTFAGDFLDLGGDLAQLQRAMGHASQTTTAGYDRRPGRAIRAVVDRLTLPPSGGPHAQ